MNVRPRRPRRLPRTAWLSAAAVAVLFGCAGTVRVHPHPPAGSSREVRAGRVSLYLEAAIRACRVVSQSPTGDAGLGDVTVEFELGEALARTIETSAGAVFETVQLVDRPACALGSDVLLLVSLAAPPYAQVHWRDQTPRVGGGTVAELIVRVVSHDCGGRELGRAVAYGFGDAEHMQIGANWPNESDFAPGIDRSLDNLRLNLVDLFAAVAAVHT